MQKTQSLKHALDEALDKITLRTKEEQKQVETELDAYRKKHGLEALNKKLLKEFKLQ